MLSRSMGDEVPAVDWNRWLDACATGSASLQWFLDATLLLAGALPATVAQPSDGEPYGGSPLTGGEALSRWRENVVRPARPRRRNCAGRVAERPLRRALALGSRRRLARTPSAPSERRPS